MILQCSINVSHNRLFLQTFTWIFWINFTLVQGKLSFIRLLVSTVCSAGFDPMLMKYNCPLMPIAFSNRGWLEFSVCILLTMQC